MVLVAVLLIVIGVLAWRWKTKVGFPLSARLVIVQWVGLGLGVVVFLASMAVIVPPGQAGVVVLFGTVQVTMFAGALVLREAVPARRWAGAV